jgi:hypothetical protein
MSFDRPSTDDPSEIDDNFELLDWLEDFRNGSSMIRLCTSCGLPLYPYFSLGEWLREGWKCHFCNMGDHGS